MDVTDVLRDRMSAPSGFDRMLTVSVLVHAGIGAILFVVPGNLLGRRAPEPTTIMTISLGGSGEGPLNGGLTAAAARPVQSVATPEDLAKREPIRPPAAKTPEMVLPTKAAAKPNKAVTAPVVKDAPEGARGRTPTKGTEKSTGQALAYTGARGEGFGLSTGGGPGGGSRLDVADFCCPGYIATMVDRIRSVWQQNQGARGDVMVKFTIQRDGGLSDVIVETSSGNTLLDTAAQRAVLLTRSLNPLPSQFSNPTLTVHLSFQYQ
jgi:TonB family protein